MEKQIIHKLTGEKKWNNKKPIDTVGGKERRLNETML